MADRKLKDWSYSGSAGNARKTERKTIDNNATRVVYAVRTVFFNLLRAFVVWFFGGRTWRRISFGEAMIWIAVAIVAGALLLLLAKQTWLLAMLIFLSLLGFAWRELSVQQ